MKKIPSIYQQQIYDFIKHGKGHGSVNAVAGSGKTTTIEESLKYIKSFYDVAFVAFNNDIVNELIKRIQRPNTKITTIHKVGWASIRNHYGHQNCAINKRKTIDICQEVLFEKIQKHSKTKWQYLMNIEKLVSLMKMYLEFDELNLSVISEKHDLNILDDEIESAIQIFEYCLEDTQTFDFDDMIFLPAINKNFEIPKFDFVFVDECQDLNKPQQEIVQRMLLDPDSRMISVGDRRQAIYGFAGADTESFDVLSNKQNTTKLPLSICYRCAKNIVLEAKKIVPHIEYFEGSDNGIVRQDGDISEIQDGDWVVCRNTKPLVVLCLELIKNHKKARVRGKDIGKGLIELIKKTKVNNKVLSLKMIENRAKEVKHELSRQGVEKPENHPKHISILEKLDIISYISEFQKDMESTIKILETIFSDEKSDIDLMTIHRSKGGENERVFFLLPQLLPSKFATQAWQKEQEDNLMYVGITRAKKELIYIRNFKYEKSKD
jgi:superfamily I DNA/RNA helicase